jgi:hypothetical protein
MIRWISAMVFAFQPSAAFAADMCGGARLTDGKAEILVLVEQSGSEKPVATLVAIDVVSLDEKMRFSVAYDSTPNGRVTPRQFFIYSSAPTAIAELHSETIRWRRDESDWHTLPDPVYSGAQGEFTFQVAQRGPSKGLTYRTEHLDELRRGGRYTVTRLSASGQELTTAFVDYPNETAVNALYARARSKAVANLKPGCKPAGFIFLAPSQQSPRR